MSEEDLEVGLTESLEELELEDFPPHIVEMVRAASEGEFSEITEDARKSREQGWRRSTEDWRRSIGDNWRQSYGTEKTTNASVSLRSTDLPEGATLQRINLLTDPNEDDFAKYLVRIGRLSVHDVVEIIDENGAFLGTKVLPHAESRYAEEMALEESARRYGNSSMSSHDLLGFLDDEDVNKLGEADVPLDDEDIREPLRFPKSVESIYKLIEPDREDDFKNQIQQINREIANIQHEGCLEHKERQRLKRNKFMFDRKTILNAVTDAGILTLPGNVLQPTIGRRINDDDLALIIETIEEIPDEEFRGFHFAYNEITDEGIAQIAEMVQGRPGILHLNLAHNNFTAAGMYALVQCLMRRPSLESLKITGVKVGDEGIDSIACLYMCGKGPRDLDVSETDMTMPGFQALCTALQAIDEDDDYPTFLTKHKLPFSLETLAQMKAENHEEMKAQADSKFSDSQFPIMGNSGMGGIEELPNYTTDTLDTEAPVTDANAPTLFNEVTEFLRDAFDTTLTEKDEIEKDKYAVDLSTEAEAADLIAKESTGLVPTVETFIEDVKMQTGSGCQSNPSEGKPVIVCPSLYSLELTDCSADDDAIARKHGLKPLTPLRVNPMYMDALVDRVDESTNNSEDEGADTYAAKDASIKFIKDTIKEAGSIAARTEYMPDSDMTQLLLNTILENARRFLEIESELLGKDSNEMTEGELRQVWEYSLKTTAKIILPALPSDCDVTEQAKDIFIQEFLKASTGVFQNLIVQPFFQDIFVPDPNKICTSASNPEDYEATEDSQPLMTDLERNTIVNDIVIKFLQHVIVHSAELVGAGDPYNIRQIYGGRSNNDYRSSDDWPSIVDVTEDMVVPLVEKLFEAGSLLAEDALSYQKKDELNFDDGIEPAQIYLEGVFKQLAHFLCRVKEDDEKLKARKVAYSTKPLRLVLNRPFFPEYEPIMASKLASYLKNNESVQCLHLRKWNLREDGMLSLMQGVTHNMNIVTLDLSNNGLGAEGCRPLGEYIKVNKNLKHLLLNHNRLRNPGLQILTNSIPSSKLLSLNVAFNDVTEVALNPFLEAIEKSRIYSLYILGNCFNQDGCYMLRNLLEKNILRPGDCDFEVQDIDDEPVLVKNSQARNVNEWYGVPASVERGLVCPPYFSEIYKPPKLDIFASLDDDVDF